jgi:hypothetical protein
VTPPPTSIVDQPTTGTAEPIGTIIALLAVTAIGGLVVGLVRPRPSRGRR